MRWPGMDCFAQGPIGDGFEQSVMMDSGQRPATRVRLRRVFGFPRLTRD